ncbi:MAG: rhodanese-like domain-containing protein [Candidatus Melainabacteria bacterium]|nr:rhodanese-like domain-containing protein [Candidatus Melainabacteria bacterium]
MFFFKVFKTPGLAHNAYLIGTDGIGILFDPRRDLDEYFAEALKNKIEIKYVFETHRQEDFVLGSDQVRQITGAKVVSGKHEFFGHSDIRLADDESIEIGDLTFQCLYTPGHTPESVSYALYMKENPDVAWAVFTGDALFIGEAGRTDLPDPLKTAENAAILFDSIHNKIAPLGDQTLLYPAHGSGSVCGGNIADYDGSTIGFERTYNPAFVNSKEKFVEAKLKERIPRPPYFRLMEQLNLKGGIPLSKKPSEIPVLIPEDFARESASGIVIDTRLPEAFAGGHIPDSYSIWLDGLPVFGGWIADEKVSVYLVLERHEDLEKAFLFLERIGVDNISGVLAGGFEGWRDAALEIEQSGTFTVDSESLGSKSVTVLDVREISEFEEGHIKESKHAYVGFLPEIENLKSNLADDRAVVLTCSVGHRASLAASILLRLGVKNVFNLLGGITAWKKRNKPLVKGPDEPQTLDLEIIKLQTGGQTAAAVHGGKSKR